MPWAALSQDLVPLLLQTVQKRKAFLQGWESTPAELLDEPVNVARSSYCRMNIHFGVKVFLKVWISAFLHSLGRIPTSTPRLERIGISLTP